MDFDTGFVADGKSLIRCEVKVAWAPQSDTDSFSLRTQPDLTTRSPLGSDFRRRRYAMEDALSSRAATKLLGRLKDVGRLEQAFAELQSNHLQVNAFHYNVLMSGFEKASHWQSPLNLAEEMQQKQVLLDAACFNVLLCSMAAGAQWQLALSAVGSNATQRGCNAVLLSLERSKSAAAETFLRQMAAWKVYPNQNSYAICMRAAGRMDQWPSALSLLAEMQVLALLPSLVAVTCALGAVNVWRWAQHLLQLSPWLDAVAACAAVTSFQRQWPSGMVLMSHLKQQKVQTDVFATNALLSAAEKVSSWKEALLLSPLNDEVSLGSLVAACSGAGFWEAALQLFAELQSRRLVASDVTLNAVTTAAQQGNKWRSALTFCRSNARDAKNALLSACSAGAAWQMALYLLRADLTGPTTGCAATLDACAKSSHWPFAVLLLATSADAVAVASVATARFRGGGDITALLQQLTERGMQSLREKTNSLCDTITLGSSKISHVTKERHRANLTRCSTMFDFDELEDAEEVPSPKIPPKEAVIPSEAVAEAPEKEPEKPPLTAEPTAATARLEEPKELPKEVAPAAAAQGAPEERTPTDPLPKELPNAKYSPEMVLECVGAVLMRQQEDLESPQVGRLAAGSLVKVLELGCGPSGKRIKVHAASGEEGWASVIASNTAPMFRSTTRPFVLDAPATAAVPVTTLPAEPKMEPKEPKVEATTATASEMPWSSIRPGDTCLCKTSVVMRREEDMNSDMIRRLPAGEELEILKSGTEPTGRRFMAKDSQGNKGWISALSKEGTILLEVTQRGNQSLYVGTGQALGGDGDRTDTANAATDRRAAALAAAEKRQAQFMSRGVGEKAAKNLRDSEQREDAPVAAPTENRMDFKPAVRESPPVQASPSQPAKAPATPAATAAPARQGLEKLKEEAALSQGLTSSEVQEVFDLEALGFDFYQALHAFAAHRNKEVAANILLESQEEPAVDQQLPLNVQFRPLPAAFPGPPLNESQLGFNSYDLQKVQRLMDLGFDRPTAVKALYHCNRNEEQAGNQLLA
eukprot:s95_g13.t1